MSSAKAIITRRGEVKEIWVIFPQHSIPWYPRLSGGGVDFEYIVSFHWSPLAPRKGLRGWMGRLRDGRRRCRTGRSRSESSRVVSILQSGNSNEKGLFRGQSPPAGKERKSSECPSLPSMHWDFQVFTLSTICSRVSRK